MKPQRGYHRGQRRAWSALLQTATRSGYSARAEERLMARSKPQMSARGQQAEVQP